MKNNIKKNPLRFCSQVAIAICAMIPVMLMTAMLVGLLNNNFDGQKTYYFGLKPTLVLTGSMEPTIRVNGTVILKDCDINDIEVGDIIRYYDDVRKFYVLHRVIEKNTDDRGEEYVITQGDANELPDERPVYDKDICGKVILIQNGTRDLVTNLFGEFNTKDLIETGCNILIGIIKLTIIIVIVILAGVWIFEYITINYFWLRKSDNMQESIEWMNNRKSKDDFNDLIKNYKEALKKSNIFTKLIIMARFRKYYDVLCSEESKALKAEKKLRKLEKTLDSINK